MNLKLVENNFQYYDFIRVLRTHPKNTHGFLEQVEITPIQQKKYMDKYSKNYFICLSENNEPIGWVGEVDRDIRVCTHPDYKGKGVGKFMINELMKINPSAEAKVLINNDASIGLFISCGFLEVDRDDKYMYFKKL
jgi:RimJ/RimL family protein N-acetyltransferase